MFISSFSKKIQSFYFSLETDWSTFGYSSKFHRANCAYWPLLALSIRYSRCDRWLDTKLVIRLSLLSIYAGILEYYINLRFILQGLKINYIVVKKIIINKINISKEYMWMEILINCVFYNFMKIFFCEQYLYLYLYEI